MSGIFGGQKYHYYSPRKTFILKELIMSVKGGKEQVNKLIGQWVNR